VTLVTIFSCFHDRDHIHPHIHDNSYTGSYAKHAIHPPKINIPKFKEISLLVILQKERGVIKKSLCSRSIEKCAPIKAHRVNHDPLQNKGKRRISKQGVVRKKQSKIFHTLAHLDQVA
jgi:hypothetical protein